MTPKLHLIYGPDGATQLHTACGRKVTTTLNVTRQFEIVDCDGCVRTHDPTSDNEQGIEGYHWEARP